MGGDSDTLATITGSIAEAYYGIPEHICQAALHLLRLDMRKEELAIVEEFTSRFTPTRCLKGEICMNYNREAWIKKVTARNAALTPEERAARLAELKAKLKAGTATDQDKDEIVSMPQ